MKNAKSLATPAARHPRSRTDAAGLRTDGPTFAEWIDQGNPPKSYPPPGYAARESPDEVAAPAGKPRKKKAVR